MMAAPTKPTPAHGATDDAARKAFATLAARAALAGYTCTRTSLNNIVLSRLGHAWIFSDVASASMWLNSVPTIKKKAAGKSLAGPMDGVCAPVIERPA